MPLDAFQQSCSDEQSQNLDPHCNNANRSYQAFMLLYPAGDCSQTTAQEHHTLSGELIEPLGPQPTLRVPHCAVLQRVHAASRWDTTGQHSWG